MSTMVNNKNIRFWYISFTSQNLTVLYYYNLIALITLIPFLISNSYLFTDKKIDLFIVLKNTKHFVWGTSMELFSL